MVVAVSDHPGLAVNRIARNAYILDLGVLVRNAQI
jgi:hypothetical protein